MFVFKDLQIPNWFCGTAKIAVRKLELYSSPRSERESRVECKFVFRSLIIVFPAMRLFSPRKKRSSLAGVECELWDLFGSYYPQQCCLAPEEPPLTKSTTPIRRVDANIENISSISLPRRVGGKLVSLGRHVCCFDVSVEVEFRRGNVT